MLDQNTEDSGPKFKLTQILISLKSDSNEIQNNNNRDARNVESSVHGPSRGILFCITVLLSGDIEIGDRGQDIHEIL